MKPPTKHQGPYDETNTYNFTFRYPLEVEQEGSTRPRALRVVDDSSRVAISQATIGVSADGRHANDHDHGSPNNGKAKTLVKEQQHKDSVS